jgi:hypothetical protein
VAQRGFRTRVRVVATTPLEPPAAAAELATLYRARWQAELDLRCLKVTPGMDVLRCQTPAMVGKEVWVHLLAYNLARTVRAQAAERHGRLPRQVSFTGALPTVTALAEALGRATAAALPGRAGWRPCWRPVAAHEVGDRPDRVGPRARKGWPRHYPLLTRPRDEARRRLGRAG